MSFARDLANDAARDLRVAWGTFTHQAVSVSLVLAVSVSAAATQAFDRLSRRLVGALLRHTRRGATIWTTRKEPEDGTTAASN